MTDEEYREELVQTLRDIGQELVDRADDLIAKIPTYNQGIDIYINIPQPVDGPPEIRISMTTFPITYYKRRFDVDL